MHTNAVWVGTERSGGPVNPFQRGEGILHRRREFVLRPHAVVDRCNQRLGPGTQVAGDQIMRVEAADNVAAAMVIDDRRGWSCGIRPIKPQADVSGRAWNA